MVNVIIQVIRILKEVLLRKAYLKKLRVPYCVLCILLHFDHCILHVYTCYICYFEKRP